MSNAPRQYPISRYSPPKLTFRNKNKAKKSMNIQMIEYHFHVNNHRLLTASVIICIKCQALRSRLCTVFELIGKTKWNIVWCYSRDKTCFRVVVVFFLLLSPFNMDVVVGSGASCAIESIELNICAANGNRSHRICFQTPKFPLENSTKVLLHRSRRTAP